MLLRMLMRMSLVVPILLADPGFVDSCKPCRLTPGPKLPVYLFQFDVATDEDGRSVKAIEVHRGYEREPLQTLAVKNMAPTNDRFYFGGEDIDFDGYLDLILVVGKTTASTIADYWIFHPQTGVYAYAGRVPILKPDRAKHRLTSYQSQGQGGMLYTKSEYRVDGGKLVIERSETQEATSRSGVYRRIYRERDRNELKVSRTELVRGDAARPK